METNRNSHFFKAAFSVDLVLFSFDEGKLKVFLLPRKDGANTDLPGLPGKLIAPDQDTGEALNKLAREVVGTSKFYRKQLKAFSDLDRHPEGRVITIAYYGLVSQEKLGKLPQVDHLWADVDDVPPLAFDHNRIVKLARHKLCKGLLRHPTVFELLPENFVLSDMIAIYEVAFRRKLDSPNFRRQVKESGLVEASGQIKSEQGMMGRRPQLFRYLRDHYERKKPVIGFNPRA